MKVKVDIWPLKKVPSIPPETAISGESPSERII